ncbi:putative arginyl-tRNA synthetase [Danaus plexippus plexippus]|uniref:Arginyl-tRNA synthetase n=2 Tax=Danaus plexippus TaxID=13037 RepID=A0A212ESC6_DANPL|nr:putative arginyl-tRNA synthetase [Danaus plexippus plexippus]
MNQAYNESEACIIVNYLFRLSNMVNRMFNELKVKNVNRDVASQRLLVFNSARFVIKTALEILGVKPLLEM